MKIGTRLSPALAILLAACSPKPAPLVTADAVPQATTAPAPLAVPPSEAAPDAAAMATAQRNLKALGYAVGHTPGDAGFQRALLAFEKDQGLTPDGQLTAMVVDKLAAMRTALARTPAAAGRGELFVYSDGAARKLPLGLIAPPPGGLTANAPANFMLPLHPGSQGSFQFGARGKDGSFKAAVTVTCQAGRAAQATLPIGIVNTIPVDCHGDGNPMQWRSVYSPAFAAVVRQDTITGVHDLVAERPATGEWPLAARLGLDWAITHALDTGTAVQWSSTAVAPHFEIKSTARLTGQEAGLSGKYAALPCRRFDVVESLTAHYPGIACQTAAGVWSLPGSAAPFASPANGLATHTIALRSAQN